MLIKLVFLQTLLGCILSNPVPKDETCKNACNPLSDTKINVHLVPHSHDDVGWLRTYDQYYVGTGIFDSIYNAGVRYILDSAIWELQKNPDRRYIQVETAFFYKWWNDQTEDIRNVVKDLLQEGRLEMVNGGWTMNDEAATHYQSIIDQFTWGFRFLDETVGSCGRPKVGWQIDPFGHSREHASIAKQLGFEGLILGRLDYRDKQQRIKDKNLDFYWDTNDNFDDALLFTSMFPDFYVYPNSFCFDVYCNDQNITDDNIKERIGAFTDILDGWKDYYKTSNILIPMGHDFSYQKAEKNFGNIDKLIEGFKDHDRYNVFYSTPSCYVRAVKSMASKNDIKLSTKKDDFFPYASDSHAFWTGYFSSRPTSKRFERVGNNMLQSVKQLTTYSRLVGGDADKNILNLRMAMGVLQHHDGITGTEKQEVADDYHKLLYQGIEDTRKSANDVLLLFLKKKATLGISLDFSYCLRRNMSICDESSQDQFVVAVHNPLSKPVDHYISIPVPGKNYKVTGPNGEVPVDIFDSIHPFDFVDDGTPLPQELIFLAKNIPALGPQLYYVEKIDGSDTYHPFEDITSTYGDDNTNIKLDDNGRLSSVTINGEELNIQQDYLYYDGFSSQGGRASGAYIFRPDGTAKPLGDTVVTKAAKGSLVDEIHQIFNNEVRQIIRVYKDGQTPFIEFDWLVGNLSVGAEGREVINRFQIDDFDNGDIFYTDSNGRQQMRRQRDNRSDYQYDPTEEPVASNYYPVSSRIVIKDENLELAVLVDRGQGGSSLAPGQLELMLHRRDVSDDGFGVDEVLNERQYGQGLYARGRHLLTFAKDRSVVTQRDLALKMLLEPLVLVSNAQDISLSTLQSELNFEFQLLTNPLPDNLHMLTLEPWKDSYLLRMEHIFEKDEDEELSKPATVNLATLFIPQNITEVVSVSLGANQIINDKEDFEVTLNPMEIKTFIVKTSGYNDGGHDIGVVN